MLPQCDGNRNFYYIFNAFLVYGYHLTWLTAVKFLFRKSVVTPD